MSAFFNLQRRMISGKANITMGQLFASKATSSLSFNSVISIIPNPNFCTPLREACILMDKEKTGALIVTDYDNKTIGLLTSRDIQKAVANKQSSVLCIQFSLY